MCEFKNRENAYLKWISAHPHGFIVNIDFDHRVKAYPMVHRATHKVMSSARRSNYTTNRYYKICSTDLQELEAWSLKATGKKLAHCKACM